MTSPRPWLVAGDDPGAPALEIADRVVSRGALAARADALAGWLAGEGLEAGAIVAVRLPAGEDFVALLHAVDRADAVLLPLDPRLPAAELAPALAQTRPRLLVRADDDRAGRAAAEAAGIPSATPPRRPHARVPRRGRALDAPLAAILTSGTTGPRKAALLSHAGFLASARASAQLLGTRPDDRVLACMPLFHVGGLSLLTRAALHGHPVVLHPRFDASAVAEGLEHRAISLLSLVPTMLERLLHAWGERPAPPSLRCVLLGGAAAPPELVERAARLGFPVARSYGLTEATSQVATLPPGSRDPARDGLVPLPGTELRIASERPGGEGEILVRSPALMAGYLDRPDDTRRALAGGWLHTGDVGRLDARGHLTVLDRRRDLIVSGGENVYPSEVEAVLREHDDVLDAAVAAAPDAEFGQRPFAWIVARPGSAPSAGELARFCRARLAGFKVPIRFEALDRLPRSPSGKLLRARLPQPPTSLTGAGVGDS